MERTWRASADGAQQPDLAGTFEHAQREGGGDRDEAEEAQAEHAGHHRGDEVDAGTEQRTANVPCGAKGAAMKIFDIITPRRMTWVALTAAAAYAIVAFAVGPPPPR